AAGAVIGTVTVADPDAGDAHTLSVSDARFEIVGGQLKLKDGVSLDHEAEPSVSVTVTATDSGGKTVSETVEIAIGDVAEVLTLTSGDDHFTDTGVAETAIHGADGDDTIVAHEDGGVIYGEGGADSLVGGAGQDSLDGGAGDDTLEGHAPTLTRQSFNWSALPDPDDGGAIDQGDDLSAGAVQNTGLVEVRMTVEEISGAADTDFESGFAQNVDGIKSGGEVINRASAAEIDYAGATAGSSIVALDFASAADGVSDEVRNVSFRVNDIDRRDGTDTVTIKAFDAFGNEIGVRLTGGGDVTLMDTDGVGGADTATARAGVGDSVPDEARSSLLVEIDGPVARIEIHHSLDASNLGGVRVTDVFFDAVTPEPGSAGDTLVGGEGDDLILGASGGDLIVGDGGADRIDGGDGDDTIRGGDGADAMQGGDGADLFILENGFGDDSIDGGEGADTIDASTVTDAITLAISGDGEGTLSIGGVEGGPAVADDVIETPGAQFEFFLLDKTAWTDPARMLASNSSSGDANSGQQIAFNGYNGVKAGIQQTLLEDGASSLAQAVTINGLTFAAGADIELDYGFIVADANGIQYFVGKVDLGGGGEYDASVITAGWNPATGEWVDPPAPGTVLTLLNLDNVTGTPWSGSHSAGQIASSDFDPYSNDVQLGPSVTAPVVEDATTPAEPVMSASFQSVEAFRLGEGDDMADASTATVDLVIEGRGGSDTILGGSGNDLIDAGDGRIDSVEATGVRSPTFNVFRLGNFGDLDPDESNGASENAAAMLGTYGSEDNPLFLHLTRATGNDTNNNGRIEDNDWNRLDAEVESYTIDGQTVKLDSGQAYSATATFTDGTTGAFLAIVVQLQNGETYLFPAFNNPEDSVLLTTKPIASVALNSVALDDGFPGTMRFDTDFKTMAGNEVEGGAGDDTILGGAGADTLTGGAGDDSLTGGGGADIAIFTGNRSDYTIVDLGDGRYEITDNRANGAANEGTDTVSGVEIFRFANGDVEEIDLITPRLHLIGTGANETLTGGATNDTIEGRGGADRLSGGEGDDRIIGGTSQDTILGGDGADTIMGGGGHDSIDAGAGADSVTTTSGNDTISGGAGDDVIIANGGADSVLGGEGDDFLALGSGNDRAWGEAGNDTIRGESGLDTIDGGAGDDSIDAGADNDLVTGGEGNDTLIGGLGDDTMTGGAGNDSLVGGDGADSLTAGDGDDTIDGGIGNDRLFGEAGDDVIDAGEGADSVTGGAGDDAIIGGGGDDRVFWSQPRSEFRILYDADTATFTIRDLDAAGTDEGKDTVSGVEFFVFGGVEYTAAQMIAEAARQETEGAGFEVNLAGGGFSIEYFDFDATVNSVNDIDWNAEPVHREAREALDFVEEVGPAFHAEATVRFDNLAGGHWQRIFDYGNGPASDNILLTQVGNSNDLRFEIYDGSASHSIVANGVIVEGETATWTAQVSDDGLMQILKNGIVVAEGQGIVPPDVERANKLVGESNWGGDTPLIGEVISITVDEDGYDQYTELQGGFNDAVDDATFALRATGSITVDEAGVYEFRLGSDDGAVLFVNGEPVIDHDGLHTFKTKTGSLTLEPGEHEIEVRYFENTGRNGLSLEWKAPGEAEFSLLRADGGLETVEASPLTLDLDVDPGGWTVQGVSLTGLPDGTILMSGDDVAVSGADPLDVTGWNLEHLEITPPAGFVGTISLEVSVDGLDSGGAAAERLSVFEIEVAPDPEAAAAPDDGGGDGDGWVDAADGAGATGGGDDVMGEDVDFSDDSGVEGAGFHSHETQDP
ncbi:MAG: PA14 domain-containing protein, partial [Pikeienuella sp.]|uniref:PA14 domain-containing protein n=1 Tax=Pikeienuella sp. TaxID=2831957 RepID=UPI0039191067